MKTPLGPSQLLESGQILAFGGMCQEILNTSRAHALSVQKTSSPGQGGAYSLCEVCNLQLTSASQAQLHYNGRSHLRRVRQLQAGETGQQTAAVAQSRTLPQATGVSSKPAGLSPTPGPSPGLLSPGLSVPSSAAAGNGGGSTPGLMGATGPSVMMKPFLPFSVETTSPVGLFPNFNTMDPVQKAVINHTFGVTMVPKRKQIISCNVCQLRFNSDSQAEAHYRGSRHAKKLKSQENKAKAKMTVSTENNGNSCGTPTPPVLTGNQHTELLCSPTDSPTPLKPFLLLPSSPLSSSSPSSSRAGSEPPSSSPPSALPAPGLSSSLSSSSSSTSPAPVTPSSCSAPPLTSSSQEASLSVESEEEKAKKLLYCSLCKVAVNSLSQLEAHNAGSKHKTMLEARNGSGPIKAYPRPGAKLKSSGSSSSSGPKGSGLQNKTFHCQICDVHVNSEIQLKQHISSRRHKDRVAGKPSKPKYSPYNKQQRTSINKELGKASLSPSFLSTPFASPPSPLSPAISLPSSALSSPSLLSPTSSPLTPGISLHPRPPASAPLFTASFLRPAPGPIRASQGSILFAPY
ncbi:zinc finger protein 385B [Oryzias latipes]|uniref:C2H2-type domain-containing protein n=1 Tax=Oryzias latipes TaxID=8090 RepID=A0A3B3IMK0_ORYLA|nr:zinc finger protein 385B [Oryzias latipes]